MKNKVAILTRGVPLEWEDPKTFKSECEKNFRIIQEIAEKEGCLVKLPSLEEVTMCKNAATYNPDSDVFFYFTGHADSRHLGTYNFKIQEVLDFLKSFKGRKYIVLDACAAEKDFDSHDFPKDSLVISANWVYNSESLAKLLHDAIITKGHTLDTLTKKTFEDMNKPEVYVKSVGSN
jgi:hypothetical protein